MTHPDELSPHAEVSVNNQGRVTIPSQVRRAAGIEPGDSVVVYVDDGRVVIETRARLVARLRRDVARDWTGSGSVVDDLAADRRSEADREAG
ncbi:MAG: AbrB/MazE/SpoVT family DNA-binding domain-containing protein [Pseudonocardia sp.]|uniref:AbrB/MazE/SpoVT family DNA-binding domain-containing protein n=1 Tax=unclassified Pseudonocardia TaxID=2619320 RepID=UPI00086D9103|nr:MULTISPECIES: AbrB/MazE/SpoVT family DNA-binding domain-containing protein [unclassified Pseudonocardia]MBN9109848.1 AbrB/MazE/SpoVT family DNA-binding domain-containing protein [Pseudonocardia sp.]ODU13917.1 MAG: AbrB family transcriptional regulator [Pseudonocardia sp. SCN 72-51]ODV03229.1 MAG: AbrB family transcriptional regulator [Pseudonocardia sp. SCN 73-27]